MHNKYFNFHLNTLNIVTKMMGLDHYTTSTSTYSGTDGPTSIKEEPDEDDDPQTVLFSNQSDVQLPYIINILQIIIIVTLKIAKLTYPS